MIFAVSPDPQTPGFDSRETEPDGFSQGGGVNVRDPVLITHPTVRKVEPLSRHISVGIRRIVCGQPV